MPARGHRGECNSRRCIYIAPAAGRAYQLRLALVSSRNAKQTWELGGSRTEARCACDAQCLHTYIGAARPGSGCVRQRGGLERAESGVGEARWKEALMDHKALMAYGSHRPWTCGWDPSTPPQLLRDRRRCLGIRARVTPKHRRTTGSGTEVLQQESDCSLDGAGKRAGGHIYTGPVSSDAQDEWAGARYNYQHLGTIYSIYIHMARLILRRDGPDNVATTPLHSG